MFQINSVITNTVLESGLQIRPHATPGIWLKFLIPLCIIRSTFTQPVISSQLYKLQSVLCVGLLGASLIFIVESLKKKKLNTISKLNIVPLIISAILFRVCVNRGFLFSVASGIFSTYGYQKIYYLILKRFPMSFSVGEAAIIAQAIVLLLYSTIINTWSALYGSPTKVLQISTLIIQIGLLDIAFIGVMTYLFSNLRRFVPFYILSVSAISLGIVVTLQMLLQHNPVLWILQFLTGDVLTIKIFVYWIICSIAAVVAVRSRIQEGQKASTAVRKIFHLLAVAVYLPGLLYQCSLLYLASGVCLGIFFALEILRILNIPPLGSSLQDGFLLYSDEKDTGIIALTPIYLLAGCSLPIWIHPAPCDILDSAGFNIIPLISGLMAVGIGDSAASIVGMSVGKHQWPGTKKTIEGTVASVLSQAALLGLIYYSGYISTYQFHILKTVSAVLIGSILEATTDQIDNLVLPLVLYLILV